MTVGYDCFFCLHWLLVVFLDFWRRGGFEIVDVKGTSSFHKRSSAVGCLTEVPLLEQEQELRTSEGPAEWGEHCRGWISALLF